MTNKKLWLILALIFAVLTLTFLTLTIIFEAREEEGTETVLVDVFIGIFVLFLVCFIISITAAVIHHRNERKRQNSNQTIVYTKIPTPQPDIQSAMESVTQEKTPEQEIYIIPKNSAQEVNVIITPKKIRCKFCVTKFYSDEPRCPNCGASNYNPDFNRK
ncbi:MAG: hypothetical protein FWE01_02630 [Firmicutes bacterium]|nr:hypothetical protein [Bacillota bacterium]